MKAERIVAEVNRVFRILFYLLCAGVFLDLVCKWNTFRFQLSFWEVMRGFGFETLLLFLVFFAHVFLLAARGIYFCAPMSDVTSFARRRTIAVAATLSAALTLGLWGVRFATNFWEYGILSGILFILAVCLVTFALAFLLFFGTFYIAWCISKKQTND